MTRSTTAVHTLILGAGPAGLACADRLAAAGLRPTVLEAGTEPGGLLRGIAHGPFRVDLGRKEIYSRLAEVHAFWRELLGCDWLPYEHRVGILHGRTILETSRGPRGPRRGLPWHLVIAGGLGLVGARLRGLVRRPRSYEQHWHDRRGALLSRLLSQGFDEKFRGVRWADLPPPSPAAAGGEPPLPADDAAGWWHPRFGTGQIATALAQRVTARGGAIHYGTRGNGFAMRAQRITAVTTTGPDGEHTWQPQHVVSTLPIEHTGRLLGIEAEPDPVGDAAADVAPRRGVVLVYLFLDEPPRFPHVYLQVTCPRLQAGRIVNYAALGGGMVPPGRTCLCVEYFCVAPDPLLQAPAPQLAALARAECTRAGLIDPARCVDDLVLQLPGADPATTTRDWQSPARRRLAAAIGGFTNLHDGKRPGIDLATAAGLAIAARIVAAARCDGAPAPP
jgi:phytoene dehydrogenase-like protein